MDLRGLFSLCNLGNSLTARSFAFTALGCFFFVSIIMGATKAMNPDNQLLSLVEIDEMTRQEALRTLFENIDRVNRDGRALANNESDVIEELEISNNRTIERFISSNKALDHRLFLAFILDTYLQPENYSSFEKTIHLCNKAGKPYMLSVESAIDNTKKSLTIYPKDLQKGKNYLLSSIWNDLGPKIEKQAYLEILLSIDNLSRVEAANQLRFKVVNDRKTIFEDEDKIINLAEIYNTKRELVYFYTLDPDLYNRHEVMVNFVKNCLFREKVGLYLVGLCKKVNVDFVCRLQNIETKETKDVVLALEDFR